MLLVDKNIEYFQTIATIKMAKLYMDNQRWVWISSKDQNDILLLSLLNFAGIQEGFLNIDSPSSSSP